MKGNNYNLSPLQKSFGQPKLSPSINRFGNNVRIAYSGIDPSAAKIQFVSKSPVKPIEKHIPYYDRPKFVSNPRYVVGTTVKVASPEFHPKIEALGDYSFPAKNTLKVEELKNHFLKSDNISVRIPKLGENSIAVSDIKSEQLTRKIRLPFRKPTFFLDTSCFYRSPSQQFLCSLQHFDP